jgi:hypothetical protein
MDHQEGSERDEGGRRPAAAPIEPCTPASAALPAGNECQHTVNDGGRARGSLLAGAARAHGSVAGPVTPRPSSDRGAAAPATARDQLRGQELEGYELPIGSGLANGTCRAARGDSGPAATACDEQARRQTTRIAVASPDVGRSTPAAPARTTRKAVPKGDEQRFSPGPAWGATPEASSASGRPARVTASPANDNRQYGSPAHGERGRDMGAPAGLPTGGTAGRAVQLERRGLHPWGHGPLVGPRLVEDHARGGRFGLGESTTQSAERCAD